MRLGIAAARGDLRGQAIRRGAQVPRRQRGRLQRQHRHDVELAVRRLLYAVDLDHADVPAEHRRGHHAIQRVQIGGQQHRRGQRAGDAGSPGAPPHPRDRDRTSSAMAFADVRTSETGWLNQRAVVCRINSEPASRTSTEGTMVSPSSAPTSFRRKRENGRPRRRSTKSLMTLRASTKPSASEHRDVGDRQRVENDLAEEVGIEAARAIGQTDDDGEADEQQHDAREDQAWIVAERPALPLRPAPAACAAAASDGRTPRADGVHLSLTRAPASPFAARRSRA